MQLHIKKQMYIFVDRNVYSEFSTYEKNKDSSIDWAHVNNTKIFEFIEELKGNNRIIINDFSVVQEIIECLKSQWAGLFQSFLSNREKYYQSEGIIKINEASERLESCADNLSSFIENMKNQYETSIGVDVYGSYFLSQTLVEFSNVLLGDIGGKLLFKTKKEMIDLLSYIGFTEDGYNTEKTHYAFSSSTHNFYVSCFIFGEDDKLKKITLAQYKKEKNDEMFYIENKLSEFLSLDEDDGDLPF